MAYKQKIYEKHSELFHYTNQAGLEGILGSQTLWATNFRHLNDKSEFQLMRGVLEDQVNVILKEPFVEKYKSAGLAEKSVMKKEGGPLKIAREEAKALADSAYSGAFEDTFKGPALIAPYVTSFCSHADDQSYEQKNGLLSQWRGYANTGGYAFVFDTRKLLKLIDYERSGNNYVSGIIDDVIYDGDSERFRIEFGPHIKKICDGLCNVYGLANEANQEYLSSVLSIFPRLKHRGFREEREVRIVVYPISKEVEVAYKAENPDWQSADGPFKEFFTRGDGVPYIRLFEGLNRHLPIKRIIVGPQQNQSEKAAALRKKWGHLGFDIHRSETPLRANN